MFARSPSHCSPVPGPTLSRRAMMRLAGGAAAATLPSLDPESGRALQVEHPPEDWFGRDATLGGHGQLVVGDGPIYLSHLPVFMFDSPQLHPHHFQVILEVSFSSPTGDALARYLADREASGATLYTFAPSVDFRMLDLIAPAGTESPVRSFPGAIFRGHFERAGAQRLSGPVTAKVERVVYANEFAFGAEPPESLEYVLFGQGEALFLAHRIIAPPSFDHVLPVTLEGDPFSDDLLRRRIILVIPERGDTIAERLRDGDRVTADAWLRDRDEPIATGVTVAAGQEIFFEEGELRFPDDTGVPTEAEIEAGFDF
jgi:hypothetical protein